MTPSGAPTRPQREKLAALLAEVLASNAFYRRKLAGAAFDARRDALASLPFTRRAELQQDQLQNPPYGTNLTYPLERYCRLHQTSGSGGAPLRWLDTPESWRWWKQCWSVIYDAAGVCGDDVIVYPFSFGPFIGFWSAFESGVERGLRCLAAGGMSTSARLRYLLDNRASVVCCTPTYALHMAEVAAKDGLDLRGSTVRALIVAGEPGGNIPATRAAIEHAWNARVFDHAGMTEIGAWGLETVADAGGLFVNEHEFIAEVLDPQTDRPVPPGETGELILTNLGRCGSPLIRYRTGDLVRAGQRTPPPFLRGAAEAGAAWPWFAGGVLGRVDDMLFIRGNNVFPAAIEGMLRGVVGLAEFRIEVGTREALNALFVDVEPAEGADPAQLVERCAKALRDGLGFRPTVRAAAHGSLPRYEMKASRVVKTARPPDG